MYTDAHKIAPFYAKRALLTQTVRRLPFERELLETAMRVCMKKKIGFDTLRPIQRLFILHYRCHACGLLPLYYLDLQHAKRIRCTKCGHLVSFRSTGKYGKLRKEIASTLRTR